LETALDLMYDQSPGGEFTVQDLVERSGQSLRSFYKYFNSKQELLLVLLEEAVASATQSLKAQLDAEDDAIERLHRFVVGYYLVCRRAMRSWPGKHRPSPAMAEFAQQLLTAHPHEATEAFSPLVELFDHVLGQAVALGLVRDDLKRRRLAGVILQAVMFNPFSTVISGTSAEDELDAAEELWQLVFNGIGARPVCAPDSPSQEALVRVNE
jgi:AcrR family transcriptional regulator